MMVLSSELRIKARQAVDELVDGIGEELDRRERLDQIEKSLFRRLLELGKSLLQQAVDEVADDQEQAAAESLPGEDGPGEDGPGEDGPGEDGAGEDGAGEDGAGKQGVALQRIERKPRRLVTVFGELRIRGPVYAVRRKQKIQRAPVDELLGLPAGEFSYLFEDWAQLT